MVTFLYISVSSRHLCFLPPLLSPPRSSWLLFPFLHTVAASSPRLPPLSSPPRQVRSCLSSSISLLLCFLSLPLSLSPLFPCQHHYSLRPPHLVPPSILRLSLHSGLVYYLSPPASPLLYLPSVQSPRHPDMSSLLSHCPAEAVLRQQSVPGPARPGPAVYCLILHFISYLIYLALCLSPGSRSFSCQASSSIRLLVICHSSINPNLSYII